jgi:methylmalonyl-CoA mutase N-terminal domain/subunit
MLTMRLWHCRPIAPHLIALRTQQIIAEETGVVNTVDPLGGSYFLESLTEKMEQEALEYFRKIDAMGGMVSAIEKGFPQREIQDSAYQYQKAVERREQVIVGVNKYTMTDEPSEIPILVSTNQFALISSNGSSKLAHTAMQAPSQTHSTNSNPRRRRTKTRCPRRLKP